MEKLVEVNPQPAAHRQTGYEPAPYIDPPGALPMPTITDDIAEAKRNLSEFGICILSDVLNQSEIKHLVINWMLKPRRKGIWGIWRLFPPCRQSKGCQI